MTGTRIQINLLKHCVFIYLTSCLVTFERKWNSHTKSFISGHFFCEFHAWNPNWPSAWELVACHCFSQVTYLPQTAVVRQVPSLNVHCTSGMQGGGARQRRECVVVCGALNFGRSAIAAKVRSEVQAHISSPLLSSHVRKLHLGSNTCITPWGLFADCIKWQIHHK